MLQVKGLFTWCGKTNVHTHTFHETIQGNQGHALFRKVTKVITKLGINFLIHIEIL